MRHVYYRVDTLLIATSWFILVKGNNFTTLHFLWCGLKTLVVTCVIATHIPRYEHAMESFCFICYWGEIRQWWRGDLWKMVIERRVVVTGQGRVSWSATEASFFQRDIIGIQVAIRMTIKIDRRIVAFNSLQIIPSLILLIVIVTVLDPAQLLGIINWKNGGLIRESIFTELCHAFISNIPLALSQIFVIQSFLF